MMKTGRDFRDDSYGGAFLGLFNATLLSIPFYLLIYFLLF